MFLWDVVPGYEDRHRFRMVSGCEVGQLRADSLRLRDVGHRGTHDFHSSVCSLGLAKSDTCFC